MCSMNGPVLKESVHSQEQTVSARMINTGGSVAHMGQGFESGDIRKQPPTISNQQERPPEWPIGHERITRRFITPKLTDNHLHQFRVFKVASSPRASHRESSKAQSTRGRGRGRPKGGNNGVDGEGRNICLHCHLLNRKCAGSATIPELVKSGSNMTAIEPFDLASAVAIRCASCAEPKIDRQLFCRVQMELLVPKFSFRELQIVLTDPDRFLRIGPRVLSGDFATSMGSSFSADKSDFWFKMPFHSPSSIKKEDIERITLLYRANLPILPSITMMKRETKGLTSFAEDYVKEKFAKWQLVYSAFTFSKIGFCLFHSIVSPSKDSSTNTQATLVQIFGSKMQEFIRELDFAFHKNPTTTDWVAITTSIALIFDMFQYIFYLLQKGVLEFSISDLRQFRAVLFTRFSVWGGLRLLGNERLLKRNSGLHRYYRSYTRFWKAMHGDAGYTSAKSLLPAKKSEVAFRYDNGVALPLPLHVVQTGYCKTAVKITCDNRKDRAMCSGCFMQMIDEEQNDGGG
ncbi:hypothetical protein F5882DRAFT_420932 [Hyaloscypha sp. PMI_1271]|nr:hypothetical protein F5882DRAFT_420932 [Hyaloscypha sp. PMI_1271]